MSFTQKSVVQIFLYPQLMCEDIEISLEIKIIEHTSAHDDYYRNGFYKN